MHSVFNIWKIHAVYIFSLTFSPSSFNLYQQPEQLWIEIHTYSFPDSSLGSSSPLSPLPWAIPLHWWLGQWRICLQCGIPGFDPWVGKIPWRRAWQPTPVFLPGESPRTEEPGGQQSMRSQMNATKHSTSAEIGTGPLARTLRSHSPQRQRFKYHI